jgi:hypothetical protein
MIAISSAKVAVSMVVFAGLQLVVVDALAYKAMSSAAAKGGSVQDTLSQLDTNNNGKVDKSEIEAFARSQGMSPDDVMGDFKELDINGDGELEYSEIATVLGESDTPPQPQMESNPAPRAQPAAAAAAAQAGNVALRAPVAAATQAGSHAASKAPVTQPRATQADSVTDDLQSLQQSASLEAGRVLATQFASLAQQLMAKSAADQKKASTYEQEARSLRGKAANLLKGVTAQTRRAAADSALQVGGAAKPKVERMNAEADELEKKAGQQRTLARKALEQVSKDQALMATFFQNGASA